MNPRFLFKKSRPHTFTSLQHSPVSPLRSCKDCVTLGKSPILSVPYFKTEMDRNSTYFITFLWGSNKIIHKLLAQYLTQHNPQKGNCYILLDCYTKLFSSTRTICSPDLFRLLQFEITDGGPINHNNEISQDSDSISSVPYLVPRPPFLSSSSSTPSYL